MAKQLKLRRGTTTQHSTFTGASGEVTVDTTKKTLVVHDGATAGGVPLATEASVSSLSSSTTSALAGKQNSDAELTTLAGMSADRATFLASAQPFAMRNRIINGDMRIDQRNAGASFSPTTSSGYNLDRWVVRCTQNSKMTVQQNAGAVAPPAGFANYLGVTSSSAYAVLAGDIFTLAQCIEGYNAADLNFGAASAQSVTLSFWVRSSLTGSFGGALVNATGNRSYPFSYNINSANTWEQKFVTIAGDTSGTWGSGNGIGIEVRFGLGAGSSFTGTANTWGTANAGQPPSTVSVVGTSGATFYITGVQLEAGSVATPFERRPYGTELMLCQRYYETGQVGAVSYAASGTAIQRSQVTYKVTKRAVPTLALAYLAGTSQTALPSAQYAESAWLGWPSFTVAGQDTINTFAASAEL